MASTGATQPRSLPGDAARAVEGGRQPPQGAAQPATIWERSEAWVDERERRRQHACAVADRSELRDCTFHPTVTRVRVPGGVAARRRAAPAGSAARNEGPGAEEAGLASRAHQRHVQRQREARRLRAEQRERFRRLGRPQGTAQRREAPGGAEAARWDARGHRIAGDGGAGRAARGAKERAIVAEVWRRQRAAAAASAARPLPQPAFQFGGMVDPIAPPRRFARHEEVAGGGAGAGMQAVSPPRPPSPPPRNGYHRAAAPPRSSRLPEGYVSRPLKPPGDVPAPAGGAPLRQAAAAGGSRRSPRASPLLLPAGDDALAALERQGGAHGPQEETEPANMAGSARPLSGLRAGQHSPADAGATAEAPPVRLRVDAAAGATTVAPRAAEAEHRVEVSAAEPLARSARAEGAGTAALQRELRRQRSVLSKLVTIASKTTAADEAAAARLRRLEEQVERLSAALVAREASGPARAGTPPGQSSAAPPLAPSTGGARTPSSTPGHGRRAGSPAAQVSSGGARSVGGSASAGGTPPASPGRSDDGDGSRTPTPPRSPPPTALKMLPLPESDGTDSDGNGVDGSSSARRAHGSASRRADAAQRRTYSQAGGARVTTPTRRAATRPGDVLNFLSPPRVLGGAGEGGGGADGVRVAPVRGEALRAVQARAWVTLHQRGQPARRCWAAVAAGRLSLYRVGGRSDWLALRSISLVPRGAARAGRAAEDSDSDVFRCEAMPSGQAVAPLVLATRTEEDSPVELLSLMTPSFELREAWVRRLHASIAAAKRGDGGAAAVPPSSSDAAADAPVAHEGLVLKRSDGYRGGSAVASLATTWRLRFAQLRPRRGRVELRRVRLLARVPAADARLSADDSGPQPAILLRGGRAADGPGAAGHAEAALLVACDSAAQRDALLRAAVQ